MPAVNVHLALADRVLAVWRAGPSAAPFDPRDPTALNAFYNGAFGPDLGYFPGGERVLSELAHGVAPADLCRSLLAAADSDARRAFAFGWATHVLGDQLIHPIVGLGVGEHLTGRRDLYVSGGADQVTHIRVEVGLDGFFALRNPTFRERRIIPLFDTGTIGFLAEGYRNTYGLEIDPVVLLRCHTGVSDVARVALPTIAHLGRAVFHPTLSRRARSWLLAAAEMLRRHGGREPLPLAVLTPLRPSSWVIRSVRRIVADFAQTFLTLAGDDFAALPNKDLESGLEAYRSPPLELLARVPGTGRSRVLAGGPLETRPLAFER